MKKTSEKAYKKSIDFLHDQLVEPVQVKRQQKTWLVWVLFAIFLLASIAIVITYNFLYIHGQQVRIDLDFKEKDKYLDEGKKITCDCALPIAINPALIMSDPDFHQPKFRECLSKNLTEFFPEPLLNNTIDVLSFGFLAIPLNSELQHAKKSYKNIIVSKEGPLMTKIGNITLLRYMNEVYNSFLNYMAIYNMDLIESSSWIKAPIDPDHKDAIDDLIAKFHLSDRKHNIMSGILGCFGAINFDKYRPEDFLDGMTSDDCLPVNCHLFDNYSASQGVVLVITFYLAVIGYVLFILQCFYQKITKKIGDGDDKIEENGNINENKNNNEEEGNQEDLNIELNNMENGETT